MTKRRRQPQRHRQPLIPKNQQILTNITFQQRETFYQQWCTHRSETEYLALDITSTSSYSELIEDVEWGYNRDEENLGHVSK